MLKSKRIEREGNTVKTMIAMYCKKNHGSRRMCRDCLELKNYALQRLEYCPFGEGKTTCAKCPVHCYQLQMREQIRVVMRYAGPRMIYTHPFQTVRHIIDSRRQKPLETRSRDKKQ